MSDNSSNNKTIAKNTALLYVRMIFILGVSFYTTRAILDVLGVVDLGIYNVVGGVVAMFSFINGSLSSASSRFITYELGRGDKIEIQKTFDTIVTVHYLFALILFVLAETIGLWFMMNKLVIPEDRMTAAFWVYQSAVLSAVIVIASAPFNAQIIAHEKMSAFSYISIYEAVCKLLIVMLLYLTTSDKLIVYGIALVCVQTSVIAMYRVYCKKHFEESNYSLCWHKDRVKTIFSYAGWVVTGSLASLCCTQGLNIVLNMFFGPAVNAARALAVQLQGALNQFTMNFLTAIKPQITKSYAQGDLNRMHSLVIAGSKYGALLMLAILIPVIMNTDFLLSLWLKEVPEHTASFVRIMLFVGVLRAMIDSTMAAIHATGDIKKTEIVEMICLFSILPLSYVLLKLFGISPEWVMILYLICEIYTQIARVWVVYPKIGLNKCVFLSDIVIPILSSGCIALFFSYLVRTMFVADSFARSVALIVLTLVITLLSIWVIALNSKEKAVAVSSVKKVFRKLLKLN